MAYNNGFPVTYQPMYYQPQMQMPQQMGQPMPAQMPQQVQQQPQPQPMPQNNNLIWVQGEAGAKSYLVAPNTTVQLWDSESQRIFLKSADGAGMPSMKILHYTIEETPSVTIPKAVSGPSQPVSNLGGEFVSREDQEALKAQIRAYKDEMDSMRAEMESFKNDLYGIAGKKSATSRKKEAENE